MELLNSGFDVDAYLRGLGVVQQASAYKSVLEDDLAPDVLLGREDTAKAAPDFFDRRQQYAVVRRCFAIWAARCRLGTRYRGNLVARAFAAARSVYLGLHVVEGEIKRRIRLLYYKDAFRRLYLASELVQLERGRLRLCFCKWRLKHRQIAGHARIIKLVAIQLTSGAFEGMVQRYNLLQARGYELFVFSCQFLMQKSLLLWRVELRCAVRRRTAAKTLKQAALCAFRTAHGVARAGVVVSRITGARLKRRALEALKLTHKASILENSRARRLKGTAFCAIAQRAAALQYSRYHIIQIALYALQSATKAFQERSSLAAQLHRIHLLEKALGAFRQALLRVESAHRAENAFRGRLLMRHAFASLSGRVHCMREIEKSKAYTDLIRNQKRLCAFAALYSLHGAHRHSLYRQLSALRHAAAKLQRHALDGFLNEYIRRLSDTKRAITRYQRAAREIAFRHVHGQHQTLVQLRELVFTQFQAQRAKKLLALWRSAAFLRKAALQRIYGYLQAISARKALIAMLSMQLAVCRAEKLAVQFNEARCQAVGLSSLRKACCKAEYVKDLSKELLKLRAFKELQRLGLAAYIKARSNARLQMDALKRLMFKLHRVIKKHRVFRLLFRLWREAAAAKMTLKDAEFSALVEQKLRLFG